MNRPAGKTIQTIDRAMAVIDLLSTAPQGLRLSAMAADLGLKSQTLLGIVRTLQRSGVVLQEETGGLYFLGPRLRVWQQRWLDHNGLAVSARATVEAFAHAIGESVTLAELRGPCLQALVNVNVQNEVMIGAHMDAGHALHALATGKLLLAFLPAARQTALIRDLDFVSYGPKTLTTPAVLTKALAKIRRQGYALADEERAPGVISLAVPVREASGRVCAALGLHAPTVRMTKARIEELLEKTRQAAASVETIWNPPPGKDLS